MVLFVGGAIPAPSTLNVTGLTTLGNASTTRLSVTGGYFDFTATVSTTTIKNNSAFAWTIATTTTGSAATTTLFRIDTTSNAEKVIIGGGYGSSDVIIGAVGTTTNLVFEENAAIHGQGTNTLTFGQSGDKLVFVPNTGFGGTTTPWKALSVGTGGVSFSGLTSTSSPATDLCLSTDNEVVTRSSGNTCATSASSLRYKQDVTPLTVESGLVEVMALRPVSYRYRSSWLRDFASNSNWNGELVGFIAEEVEQIDPRLITTDDFGLPDSVRYSHLSAVLTKALQEINLRIETIASTTASSTPESQSFATSFFQSFFTRITTWLADAANGIVEVFANTFRAKEKICVDDQCLTKEDIRALLDIARNGLPSGAGATSGGSGTGSSSSSAGTDSSSSGTDTEPPVITILGNNPATIEMGANYADLGATVSDNRDTNLGVHVFIEGVEVQAVSLDTSTSSTHTIEYRATDSAGNTGIATRTVNVEESVSSGYVTPGSIPEPEAESKPEPTLETTSVVEMTIAPEPIPEPTLETEPIVDSATNSTSGETAL